MTYIQFSYLTPQDKERLLKEKGEFLLERVEGETLYDLYQVDKYYVEYGYELWKGGEVTVNVFNNPERFIPYLEKANMPYSQL